MKRIKKLIGCEKNRIEMTERTNQFPIGECPQNEKYDDKNIREDYFDLNADVFKPVDRIFEDNYRSIY